MPSKSKLNYKPGKKDLCQTPGYALTPILRTLCNLTGYNELKVWECASGEGYMANAIRACGFNVIETDINDGYDFLTYVPTFDYDVIVTNPPFSLKYEFLKKCYELEKRFALLMPVDVLGAAKAQRLFSEHGGGAILLSKRINFKMPNVGWKGSGAQFPVAWFTYGLGLGNHYYAGQYELEFYDYSWLTDDIRKEYEI